MKRYLLFVSKPYSFAILRPLAQAIAAQGGQACWFVHGCSADGQLLPDERRLHTTEEVRAFDPRAVFAPGNWVPDFFPGVKVQVFHGFGIEKKGHFRIRGLFDLYCTQGPTTTTRFQTLRQRHRHFAVAETGWPKMDPLFVETPEAQALRAADDAPIVLYAPTFSPALTSASALHAEIERLSRGDKHRWLVKFHPKMDTATRGLYQAMQGARLQVRDDADILPLLQAADVMLSDTSSVVTEFLLLDKPVVTYHTVNPGEHVLNIEAPEALEKALDEALARPPQLIQGARNFARDMHPYKDGLSSVRILEATERFIAQRPHDLVPKPWNLKRRMDIRRRMRYYRWR